MAKFTYHHSIPFLKRLYRQRDEARKQRDDSLRELNNAWKQRDELLKEAAEVLTQRDESRRELDRIKGDICLEFSCLRLDHYESKPALVPHMKWRSYLSENFNKPGIRILEIGSRNVTGNATRTPFSVAYYVGFDFYEGENVDVVGDAHKLSCYFGNDEKFDLIFSNAVFEHFHMPWIVAQEIQKLLKIGGYVFVHTHFSFSYHEKPWNFFQFSHMGLRVLFNNALGFELVDYGMSNPMNGVFSQEADEVVRGKPIPELYCHSGILCKKVRDVPNFDWGTAELDEIVANTRYPAPKRPVSFR
jgi:SAM-dependent methyltransferase